VFVDRTIGLAILFATKKDEESEG